MFFIFSPSFLPRLPPIPESISSKTKPSTLSTSERIDFSANITRDISPPEAIFESGFHPSPMFGSNRKRTWSFPFSSMSFLFVISTLKCAFSNPKSFNSSSTFFSN